MTNHVHILAHLRDALSELDGNLSRGITVRYDSAVRARDAVGRAIEMVENGDKAALDEKIAMSRREAAAQTRAQVAQIDSLNAAMAARLAAMQRAHGNGSFASHGQYGQLGAAGGGTGGAGGAGNFFNGASQSNQGSGQNQSGVSMNGMGLVNALGRDRT